MAGHEGEGGGEEHTVDTGMNEAIRRRRGAVEKKKRWW